MTTAEERDPDTTDPDETTDPAPESEEPQEQPQARIPPPPPIAPPGAAAAKKDDKKPKKGGRPRGPIGRVPQGVGQTYEADMLWNEVLHEITELGHSAHDMMIRVGRVGVGGYTGLGNLEAAAVDGSGEYDRPPSEMLRDAIIDTFHITSQGPTVYDVAFVWKRGGTFYNHGKLNLPAMREINAFRNAQMKSQGGQTQYQYTVPAPAGAGRPMPQSPHYPQPPPQPDYSSPHAPQEGQNTETLLFELIREMRADSTRLSQRIEELARRDHAPAQAAPPPSPTKAIEETMGALQTIAKALEPFGVKLQVPTAAGVGAPFAAPQAPAAPPPPPPKVKTEEEMLEEFLARKERAKKLDERLAKAYGVPLDDPDPEPEPEPEKKEEVGLGFHVHEVHGAKWPDGSPMHHATDEKGNWDLGGLLLSNPYIIDKFGTAALAIVQKFAPQGPGGAQGQQQQEQKQEQLPGTGAGAEPNGGGEAKPWKDF